MTIHWVYLLLGAFLALIPGKLLRGNECRHFQCEQLIRRLTERRRRQRRWWKHPALWIDPVRGFVATWLLMQSITISPDHSPDTSKLVLAAPLLIKMVIMTIGVTLQTPCNRDKKQLIAPFGYLSGMLLAWMPASAGIPAVVLGLSTSAAFRRWEAGFLVGTCAILILGVLFMDSKVATIWTAGLYAWPMMLSWFMHRQLVVPVRT